MSEFPGTTTQTNTVPTPTISNTSAAKEGISLKLLHFFHHALL